MFTENKVLILYCGPSVGLVPTLEHHFPPEAVFEHTLSPSTIPCAYLIINLILLDCELLGGKNCFIFIPHILSVNYGTLHIGGFQNSYVSEGMINNSFALIS